MPGPPQREPRPTRPDGASAWPVKRLESAGGLVVDQAADGPRVALIRHRTIKGGLVWTVPKGAVEDGESTEQAALREVREETGLEAEIVEHLKTISYWYSWPPDRVRYKKTVHLFLMRLTGGDPADHDDEVEEVHLFALDDAIREVAYASEREVLKAVRERVLKW